MIKQPLINGYERDGASVRSLNRRVQSLPDRILPVAPKNGLKWVAAA